MLAPSWPAIIALCPSMPNFPLLLMIREVLAGWTVPSFGLVCTWAGIMIVVTTKLHKVIPLVRADACAALKHTLLVIRFYFIRSFLSMGCPTDFAARILKILACSWNLACTFKGCFHMLWRAHSSTALGLSEPFTAPRMLVFASQPSLADDKYKSWHRLLRQVKPWVARDGMQQLLS
jgi:hypothetical protein